MQLSINTTESMREHGLTVESHAHHVTVSGFRSAASIFDSREYMRRQGYFVQTLDLIDCETGRSTPILAVKWH